MGLQLAWLHAFRIFPNPSIILNEFVQNRGAVNLFFGPRVVAEPRSKTGFNIVNSLNGTKNETKIPHLMDTVMMVDIFSRLNIK